MGRRLLLLVLAAAALFPPAAEAATRYAAPGGATTGNCTDDASGEPNPPCRLDRAVSSAVAAADDEIVVQSGTHDLTSTPATAGAPNLHIHGAAGQPRPTIVDTDNGVPLTIPNGSSGTTLRYVELRSQASSSGSALALGVGITVQDVVLRATRTCISGESGATLVDVTAVQAAGAPDDCINVKSATLRRVAVTSDSTAPIFVVRFTQGGGTIEDSSIAAGDGATALGIGSATVRRVRISGGDFGIQANGGPIVSDSIVTTSVTGKAAIYHYLSNGGQTMQLRNVTAIASGTDSKALFAQNASGINQPGRINARNVIARGDAYDLYSAKDELCGSPPCTGGTIDAAFSNFRTSGGTGTTTAGEGNQSADPLLLGDFRLADGSPAIDAGTADSLGPSAFDGSARVQGAGVDIGAQERAPAAPPPGDGPPAGMGETGPPPSPPDTLAPSISAASLVSRAIPRGRALRLRITSSEAGSLRARVVRTIRGRRRGGRCVPGLRSGRRCARRRVLKTITLPLPAGRSTLRLRAGPLPVGRLRLEIVASDAAGNRSPATRLAFRVRR